MSWQIRPMGPDDAAAARRLGREAFGVPPSDPGPAPAAPSPWPGPGRRPWGTYDGTVLAARAISHAYESHFGGQILPTNGLAGVTVAAEYRGRGLLHPLLEQVLDEGRSHGLVISTLFASAPGVYRRSGFEFITSHDVVEIPATAAAAVAPGPGEVTTRRAVVADFDAIFAVYSRWAALQNGPLTRTGPMFPAVDLTEEFTGVTLAVDAGGQVLGYASWDRGPDEGPDAVLRVDDFIALRADAYRALWRTIGSFAAVAGRIHLRSSGRDVSRLFLGPREWRTIAVNPYMLRVDDVAGALTQRRLHVERPVTFAVDGDRFGVMDGTYDLVPPGSGADDDAATCVRTGPVRAAPPGAPVYTPGGLALAWSGAQSHANIRMAGGLTGGDDVTDAVLDRALTGYPLHIRDGF